MFPIELADKLRQYTDKYGCIVMKDAIEHQDEKGWVAGMEDGQ